MAGLVGGGTRCTIIVTVIEVNFVRGVGCIVGVIMIICVRRSTMAVAWGGAKPELTSRGMSVCKSRRRAVSRRSRVGPPT